MPFHRPAVRGTLPVLQPRGAVETLNDNPWILWQPVDQATSYTCTRCQQARHGLRFLELAGTEPPIFPILPRDPAAIEHMTSRLGRQLLCPACRYAKPVVAEKPKPRKTTLD